MIEVEKKFSLVGDTSERLTNGAELVSKKTFTDAYYDTADYALTKADKWLRCRAGRFELKMPLRTHTSTSMDQYEELENETAVKKALNIESWEPLEKVLPSCGYKPFAKIATTRAKYKKDGFTIDIDAVDYGYDLAEIELMVNSKDEIEEWAEFAERSLSILPGTASNI